jgi:hypothetical protein
MLTALQRYIISPENQKDRLLTRTPKFEMDALNRGRNSLIAASALILFAIVYYSLIYRFGLNLADEGNVALISQRLMHGERPFLGTFHRDTTCSGFIRSAPCSGCSALTCS